MKWIIFGVVLIIAIASSYAEDAPTEDEKKAMETMGACMKEQGVTPDEMKAAFEKKDGPMEKKMACTMACMMTKFGVLKEDKTFDEAKMKEVHEKFHAKMTDKDKKESMEKAAKTCVESLKGKEKEMATICDAASAFFECIKKTAAA